jgi:hypothetical protein
MLFDGPWQALFTDQRQKFHAAVRTHNAKPNVFFLERMARPLQA